MNKLHASIVLVITLGLFALCLVLLSFLAEPQTANNTVINPSAIETIQSQ